MAMHPKILNVGDSVAHSSVGPGHITGYHKNGYPEVNGKAVGSLTRADGLKFGVGGTLRLPDGKAPAPKAVGPLTTMAGGTALVEDPDAVAPTPSPAAPPVVPAALATEPPTAPAAASPAPVAPEVHVPPPAPVETPPAPVAPTPHVETPENPPPVHDAYVAVGAERFSDGQPQTDASLAEAKASTPETRVDGSHD